MKSLSTSAAVQVGSDTVEVFALVGKSVERSWIMTLFNAIFLNLRCQATVIIESVHCVCNAHT